jgi:hypothetical protein
MPPATNAVFVDVADDSTFSEATGRYHPAMITDDGRIIPESEELLDSFLAQASWRSIARNEVTLLLQDKPKSAIAPAGGGRPLDEFHRLTGAQMVPPLGGDTALIVLNYEIRPKRKMAPWLRFYLVSEGGKQFAITKGPVALSAAGEGTVTEAWAIRPSSSIPPGKYRGLLLFYDNHEAINPGKARFEKRTFDLGDVELR